ncbi:hypothetical protein [Kitasatospora herbaricolor]|uniref:Uncharacterized protein n=1 Tax=Kitasatospora herbaricolor TaxID=68217 RepID=A0ABZ1WJE6_9ACTN|nr:hypothetical protein [Kitasatospora herbaricolor]
MTDALETLVVEALVRGGLDLRRDPHTREWVARRITGPRPA